MKPGQAHMKVSGPPLVPFSLWRSTDLKNWSEMASSIFERGQLEILDSDLPPGQAFYRISWE